MSHPRFRPLGIAIALTAALGLAVAQPGAAQVSGRGATRLVLPRAGLLERAWDWLAGPGGVPGVRSLSRLWAGDYGGIDPNGAKPTGTPPAPPATGAGPGLAPDGHP
jgi:hypothetical protein